MLSWSCPHISWWLLLILFSWASIQGLLLLSLQEAYTLFWYLLWAVHMDTSSVSEVWAWEAVSIHCVHFRVTHFLPWWFLVWEGLIPSTLWAPCCSPIFWINGGPSWAGGGTDWFLPSLSEVGSSFWYHFRCVLITLHRAVFTPSFDLFGVDLSSLVAMIVKWTAGRVVLLFLCGDGKELSKWGSQWGSAYKGDIW